MNYINHTCTYYIQESTAMQMRAAIFKSKPLTVDEVAMVSIANPSRFKAYSPSQNVHGYPLEAREARRLAHLRLWKQDTKHWSTSCCTCEGKEEWW